MVVARPATPQPVTCHNFLGLDVFALFQKRHDFVEHWSDIERRVLPPALQHYNVSSLSTSCSCWTPPKILPRPVDLPWSASPVQTRIKVPHDELEGAFRCCTHNSGRKPRAPRLIAALLNHSRTSPNSALTEMSNTYNHDRK